MKKLIVVLVSVLSLSAIAQDNPKFMNVLAVNGLNMRSEPDSKSRVVTKVPYGKQVELLEKSKVELQLGWITENWYKVRFRGREGFIYGGYLSVLKAPTELGTTTLSDLLPIYCTTAFKMDGTPVKTVEASRSGDTLKHTLIRFTNRAELELEQEKNRSASLLILPSSPQEVYVLLESILKKSGNQEMLNELRFVRGKDGKLIRVSNSEGTISIRQLDDDRTSLTLRSFLTAN